MLSFSTVAISTTKSVIGYMSPSQILSMVSFNKDGSFLLKGFYLKYLLYVDLWRELLLWECIVESIDFHMIIVKGKSLEQA